ncbi:hypothetical protein [Hyalangium versicolor]|uniref:hypothetical protein n=1 Tax=Hyalangium versicolor TaxID=2861190 RepID=UPI001CCE9F3A|nr:hypothetical protein [Hyalangium versicolor]
MRIFGTILVALMIACATQPVPADDARDLRSQQELGPFRSVDDVEEALCPIIMEMPGAQSGPAGIEYCGFIYHAPQGWYSTKLTYLPHQRPGDVRRCRLPDNIGNAQDPTALIVTVADFHSHPWPNTEFSEARWVQGRLRGDLMPTPGHPTRLSIDGEIYQYRRVLFSTRCDHYRYFPYSQEILKHEHSTSKWDKIANVELTVDSQTGEIIRGTARLLPGKNW